MLVFKQLFTFLKRTVPFVMLLKPVYDKKTYVLMTKKYFLKPADSKIF